MAPHGTSAIGISCHWLNESVTGVCTGALNSIDVTGWTWADLDHILDFFSSFTPVPGGVENYEEIDSAWAPEFFSTMGFESTNVNVTLVYGWINAAKFALGLLGVVRDEW